MGSKPACLYDCDLSTDLPQLLFLTRLSLHTPSNMPKESKPRATKGAAKGAKGKKDPNAPKKPLSAYMFFSKDAREEVKSENPDVSFGQIGKLLGAKWASLGDEEKSPYNEMASKDKERYEQEKAAYEDKPKEEDDEEDEKKAKASESE